MTELSTKQLNSNHRQVPPDYYQTGIEKNIFQRYWHSRRFKIIPRLMKDISGEILDLGCHSGLLSNQIAKQTRCKLTGLDISETAIHYAQQKYPDLSFRVVDLQEGIPFPDQSFQAVTAFDVLEHLPNLEKITREMNRVLKSRGYLILGIPNENWLWKVVWYFWTKSRGKVWHDVHIHQFNNYTLNKYFGQKRFERRLEKKIHLNTYWIIKYQKKV